MICKKYKNQKSIEDLYIKPLLIILLSSFFHGRQAQAQIQYCVGSTAVPVFFEDFGAGTNPGPPLPAGTTNYNYVNGWPTDGWYTIWNNSNPNNTGDPFWHASPDHTGNPNGYMMVVNANLAKGEFYRRQVTGLCPNTTYYFSVWAANANNPNLSNLCGNACVQSDVLIKIENASGVTLNSTTTGTLPRLGTLTWKEYGFSFSPSAGQTTVNLVLVNNGPGGDGNDLVLDDISFKVCLPNVTIASTPICVGNNVTITGTIGAGYANPVMQWQVSDNGGPWTDIPGATTPTLLLNNVQLSPPIRRYRLVVAENGNLGSVNCRFVSNTITVNVVPPPAPLITPHESCTAGGSMDVAITGGLAPYTYLWSTPPGGTTQSISGLTPGTYSVTVTDENGCVATASATITSPPPLSSTTNSMGVICGMPGSASVTVSNGTPAYTYLWSNGETTSAITGLSSGSYSVTVTDAKGCTKIDTFTITTSGSVTAIAGPSSSICAKTTLPQVITASGGINYLWNTGETTNSISVIPSSTTTYTVIVSVANCSDTAEVTVTVNPLPAANLSGTNVCFNNLSVFTDLSAGNNTLSAWNWDFGDGNTSTAQNPQHTYGSPGTYTVNLIVTNNYGCKDTNSTTVIVNPLPLINFKSAPVCFRDTTCFTDLSTISSGSLSTWSWNFGDPASGVNDISNLQNPCHVFSGPGPFNVILTVTSDSGCQGTTNHPTIINMPPVALFTNSSVCLNSTTNFNSTSTSSGTDPITAWNWNFGDGSGNGNGTNPAHTYTIAGTYTVVLVVTTALGCKDTTLNPITVHIPPVANFSGSGSGCAPLCVANYLDLSVSTDLNIASWQWSFPGGLPVSSPMQNPPKICYSSPGTYGASLVVTSNYGCKDSIAITPLVTVYPWPVAEFGVAPGIAPATSPVFNFNDLWSGGVTHWVWDFGDGSPLDSTNTDPVHSYSANATANDFYSFNTCLRVQTQYGCWDTVCHTVELLPEFTFYIPNTVTPNGDFINESFFGKSRGVKEYNIWLFDRWGNLVWDCNYTGKNTDWDAPMQDGMSSFCQWNAKVEQGGADMSGGSNELMQEDVYIWKVKLTDVFDKKHTYMGHVNIIR